MMSSAFTTSKGENMKTLIIASATALSLVGCAGMTGDSGTQPTASGTQRTAGQAVDDVTIGTKLKAALASDPELSALKINVDTTQGNVRLRGEVKSIALRRKAEETARRIEGVKSVDNQLMVTG
jgi:hyperosmotically inducible periplasmic protein